MNIKLHSCNIELLLKEQEIHLWRIEVNGIRAYVVADELSGFCAENEDGTRNTDVGIYGTLNEALEAWKIEVCKMINMIHF